jgi:DNA-nicking Smr family endonuclease
MKKRRTPEKTVPDFQNNPFRSLKGLKPAAAAADGDKKRTPARREDREEEDLFRRAMAGARPLSADEGEPPDKKQQKRASEPVHEDRDEAGLFLQAMQKIGTTFREQECEPDEGPRQTASSRMKQLKRGTIRVTSELDLHGYLRDEALAQLQRFLAAACARGEKAVLVITGKGINSPEGPVLQGAAAEWLRGKGKTMVAEFGPAPRDKGGSGAFVVFLKNK